MNGEQSWSSATETGKASFIIAWFDFMRVHLR